MHYRILLPILVLLFVTGNLFAQPQAPITWGQLDTIRSTPCTPYFFTSKGDTFLAMERAFNRYLACFISASVSTNSGQTWTPWHTLVDTNQNAHYQPRYIDGEITNQGIYIAEGLNGHDTTGIYWTTNNGISWNSPLQFCKRIALYSSHDDTLIGTMILNYNMTQFWTVNGGATYHTSTPITDPYFNDRSMELNGGHLLVASTVGTPVISIWHGTVATNVLQSVISPATNSVDLEGDVVKLNTYGRGILVFGGSDVSFPYGQTMLVSHTTDFGQIWSSIDSVSASNTASLNPDFHGHVSNQGKIFALCWHDTCSYSNGLPSNQLYAITRISANEGRSWYPPKRLFTESPITVLETDLNQIEIEHDSLHYDFIIGNGIGGWCVRASGQLHRDTLAPIITNAQPFPAIIARSVQYSLSANFNDNDSVWLTQCIIRPAGSTDSLILPFIRNGQLYSCSWTPRDTGSYEYYLRAEDMWENVTRLPDTTTYRVHVLPPESVNGQTTIPTTPFVKIYPNPGNATFTIIGALPVTHTSAMLIIYDLLGREVFHSTLSKATTGTRNFHYVWSGRDNSGVSVASGIYYCRVGTLPPMKIAVVR